MEYVLSFENDRVTYFSGKRQGRGLYIAATEELRVPEAPEGNESGGDRALPVVKTLADKYHLRGKKVVMVLPSVSVMYRELLLPDKGGEKQLRAMIWNEMLYYHSNIAEYTVDYIETGRRAQDGRQYYIAYALRNSYLEEYQALFKKAELRCARVDIVSNCLAKLTASRAPGEDCLILLRVEQENIALYLVEDSCCILARRLGMRYDSFPGGREALASELADQVRKLYQFQSTRRKDVAVGRVLLLGDIPEKEEFTAQVGAALDAVSPSPLPCAVLPGPADKRKKELPEHCLKAAGALFVRKK